MTRSTYLVVALLASVLLVVSFCNAQFQENPGLLLPSQGAYRTSLPSSHDNDTWMQLHRLMTFDLHLCEWVCVQGMEWR